MKKFLMAALPAAALFLAGCNECKTGLQLKSDMATFDTLVMGTIASPDSLDNLCAQFDTQYDKKLIKGAKFAMRAANERFSWTERRCLSWHWERPINCYARGPGYYPGYPHHPGYPGYPHQPGYYCPDVRVCDQWQETHHEKPGYKEARSLATSLSNTDKDMIESCKAHREGRDAAAYIALAMAKLDLRPVQNDAEFVLRQAGCYNRKGD